MQITYFQRGFNYGQDGPGNRLVYHLQGCNMRCPWCANPEGLAARSSDAQTEDVEDAIRFTCSARPMFFDGGGLTLTGGEASMQYEAASQLFTCVRAEGVNTCVETNGASDHLRDLLGLIDHLILDVKHYDTARNRAATGLGNETTFRNLREATIRRMDVLVRVPLINGFNASEDDAEGFINAFAAFPRDAFRIEFLPYHEFGKEKWARAGLAYSVTDGFVSTAQLKAFYTRFEKAGWRVTRT